MKSMQSHAKYRLKATQMRSASPSETFLTMGGKNVNWKVTRLWAESLAATTAPKYANHTNMCVASSSAHRMV